MNNKETTDYYDKELIENYQLANRRNSKRAGKGMGKISVMMLD